MIVSLIALVTVIIAVIAYVASNAKEQIRAILRNRILRRVGRRSPQDLPCVKKNKF
ncbi:MAG: hypothetical protein JWP81_383 [Ferruginibacter sp.]|nr:hypothetical protein [Ferruginibacter sp.]